MLCIALESVLLLFLLACIGVGPQRISRSYLSFINVRCAKGLSTSRILNSDDPAAVLDVPTPVSRRRRIIFLLSRGARNLKKILPPFN